jgi:hypothetical protein
MTEKILRMYFDWTMKINEQVLYYVSTIANNVSQRSSHSSFISRW